MYLEYRLNFDQYFPICGYDGKLILPSDSVHKLGVIIDSYLIVGHHMNSISKSVNYHLRRIAHIRKYCSTKKLTNILILSRIDYCGSLFSNMNSTDIKKYI